ncbi:hypothetical protein [Ectopseudomonas alcaliphila]|uniref:HEPN domain-containing protein n=2 Tax=Ectopseudomonas alcaliphila TaxID=101564 RepID=A0ABU4Q3Y8_9GAMM|nr:hypothetical protein [Pseudomonas alcaliphila]MDX5993699.1 hypothetical protein [Pseudomonas alcaliphila]
MFREAQDRLHDAEVLARSLEARSDSQAIIRVLGFEILLKCALLLSGQEPKNSHNYRKLWLGLPGRVKKHVFDVASATMPGHADLTNLEEKLQWWQFVFERARYHYELYENYTLKEQTELGELWVSLGAPTHEAVVQYFPSELECLIAGLTNYIEGAA